MSAVAQIDRAALEKMEKGQLLTISSELKLKANTRTKKAEIIDQILVAAHGAGSSAEVSSSPSTVSHVQPKVSGSEEPHTNGAATSAPRGPSENKGPAPAVLFPPITVVPKARREVTNGSSTSDTGDEKSADGSGESNGGRSVASRGSTDFDDDGPQGGRRGESNDQLSRRARRRRGRDRGSERSEQGPSEGPSNNQDLMEVEGILDLRDEGFGFIRSGGYLPSPRDVYVAASVSRKFGLRKGDHIVGAARAANSNEKYSAIVRVDSVSGLDPEEARTRVRFEDLTPLFPDEKLKLEMPGESGSLTARIIDLISPIGKGQRGLIVSPPKAGKTTIMKHIAHSIEANNPDVHLMVLLVGERPEEVTDMQRSVQGEVVASTFDRPAEEHTVVAELVIERAKRMVELGRDVVIILDGITRLARAYNLAQPATGRIMSGGVDSGALYPPKRFFGAARNVEEGGSLTVLATALVETGSKMDEVIFEEFKGTGNMELRLDRRLAERRLYPAIEVNSSSTRHEELLFSREALNSVWKLRRVLNALAAEGSSAPGLELLIDKIRSTRSNQEFLAEIQKSPVG